MNRIPYQINLTAEHGLEDLSEAERDFLVASDCASTVAGLFWLINYAVEDEAFNSDTERNSLFLSLSRVSKLGTAVASELGKVLAKIEDESPRETSQK